MVPQWDVPSAPELSRHHLDFTWTGEMQWRPYCHPDQLIPASAATACAAASQSAQRHCHQVLEHGGRTTLPKNSLFAYVSSVPVKIEQTPEKSSWNKDYWPSKEPVEGKHRFFCKFTKHLRPGRMSSGFLLRCRLSKHGYRMVGQTHCN